MVREKADDDRVSVRLNTRAGGAEFLQLPLDEWQIADQSSGGVDCALIAWMPPADMRTDIVIWELSPSAVATDELMRQHGVGIGDDVFMVGLFRNHLGRDRNEPIIRVGNIAAIPADPIGSKHFGDMRVILIEARSIGGLSGSPVFVHLGFTRQREGILHARSGERPFLFLGLMHGHWDVFEAEADDADSEEKINTGIAIIVPAQQIMESIHPYMEGVVNEIRRELEEENEPVLDEGLETPPSEFERFEDLSRKILAVPKSEIDEKRESGS
jgi:hypothetical protein